MRIGIFDPYLDTLGGGEKYMLTAASCLSKSHDVAVFWNDPSLLIKAHERFGLDFSRIPVVQNIFSPSVSLLRRLWETRKYDIIIYLSDGSIPFTLAKKLIVHFQFPVEWVFGQGLVTTLKLSRVYKIICNSMFTKRFIDPKFNVESLVIYPPVDEVRSAQKENVILTVGRFGRLPEGKNFKKQDVMIKAFKTMVDEGLRGWKFVLVISFRQADMSEVEKLEELAKGYPIEIVKNVNYKKMHALYEKAKVYWHAAGFGEDVEKHPEWAEHFGIATVEAMGSGAVPVVINAGGQMEIVDDEKNGFLWNTISELKEKTRKLVDNPGLLLRLAKNAQEKAKVFTGNRFCQQIYELVQT